MNVIIIELGEQCAKVDAGAVHAEVLLELGDVGSLSGHELLNVLWKGDLRQVGGVCLEIGSVFSDDLIIWVANRGDELLALLEALYECDGRPGAGIQEQLEAVLRVRGVSPKEKGGGGRGIVDEGRLIGEAFHADAGGQGGHGGLIQDVIGQKGLRIVVEDGMKSTDDALVNLLKAGLCLCRGDGPSQMVVFGCNAVVENKIAALDVVNVRKLVKDGRVDEIFCKADFVVWVPDGGAQNNESLHRRSRNTDLYRQTDVVLGACAIGVKDAALFASGRQANFKGGGFEGGKGTKDGVGFTHEEGVVGIGDDEAFGFLQGVVGFEKKRLDGHAEPEHA